MGKEMNHPEARQDDLLISKLADEVLVYDLQRDKALCLNGTAARVWERCDGRTSPAEMSRLLGIDETTVWFAVQKLGRGRLLQRPVKLPREVETVTRRQHFRTLGKAAAVVAPIVTVALVPTAAYAASCRPSGQHCSSSAQCCSGICGTDGYCV